MNNVISKSDAGLMLPKYVTEGIPVLAYFMLADHSVSTRVSGFVLSYSKKMGLVIGLNSPELKPVSLALWMEVPHDVVSRCRFSYTDESEVREGSIGSGLRLRFPNGHSLTLLEQEGQEKQ